MTKKTTTSKRGLGRGLEALFPVTENAGPAGVVEVRVSEIRPNSLQPRKEFDEEKLEELAQSISNHGVLQPVVVRSVIGGYELVAGERRWRACRAAGITTIPAVVKELSDNEMMEMALIENLQREDLNPLEEAQAFRTLIDEYGLTQEELAHRIGKSRSHIANTLRLLNLPREIQEYVSRGTISMGHARALLGVGGEERQLEICRVVVNKALSVRETEALVRRQVEGEKGKKAKKEARREPYLVEIEENLRESLGTKVQIIRGKQKGRIEIEYYTNDDLERICGILGGRLAD